MRPTDPTTEKLLRLAEPVCKGAGYELVDLALAPSREGLVLRVFIDYLPLPELPLPELPSAELPSAELPSAKLPSAEIPQAGQSGAEAGTAEGETGAVRPPAERSEISLADCERLSRELGAALDVEDVIGPAYHLEVSSPGVDRPLRTLEHFRRFVGQEIKVKLHDGVEGRRNFKGVLLAVSPPAGAGEAAEAGATITMNVDGREYALPFDDIESARIVPDWDAIMGKGTGKPGHS